MLKDDNKKQTITGIAKYILNLSSDNRVLSVGSNPNGIIPKGMIETGSLPDGDYSDYLYIDGEYIYDPLPVEEIVETPTQLDILEAQVTYTAMMTDTLLETEDTTNV